MGRREAERGAKLERGAQHLALDRALDSRAFIDINESGECIRKMLNVTHVTVYRH